MLFQRTRRKLADDEGGVSLIEVMASILISSIIALGILKSAIAANNTSARSIRDNIAMQLAIEKMEEFSRTDPSTLDDGDDLSESGVTRDTYSFARISDVTIEADGTRTVNITVTSDATKTGSSVTIENSFALWGER